MTSRTRRKQPLANTSKSLERIDSVILWIALGVLFITPLIFSFAGFVSVFNELKLVTLHLGAGLIAILWLWQSALTRMSVSSGRITETTFDLFRWLDRNPSRWLVAAFAAWIAAQALSTLLSPLPAISLLGAEDSRSGYNLYDNISLFVVFTSVAFRFRSERNLKLLVYSLISSGTIAAIYGIAQHFGWDPLGDGESRTRVWSSFGNPLNFGAYMVMTIPATLAMAIPNRNHQYLWLGVIVVALGLQLSGLWYTGGRGPYISFAVALIAFGLITVLVDQTKSFVRTGTIFVAGLLVAIIIIVLPSPHDDTGLERVLSIGDQIAGTNDTSGGAASGLDARFDIWGSTFDLATSWDTPQDDSGLRAALRPVFGLGPDMYVYSYAIAANPHSGIDLVDHPHNYELQLLVEQGLVGVLLFIGAVLALLMIIYRLITQAKSANGEIDFKIVLLLAITPSIIGKLVEMQTGVSRVSDLVMTFALFGAIAALWTLSGNSQSESSEGDRSSVSPSPSSVAFSISTTAATGAVILSAVLVTTVALSAFAGWDLRRTLASRSWVASTSASTDVERATGWFESQKDAPERPLFTNSLFIELFNAAIDQKEQGDDDGSLQLMHTARELLVDFEKRDPYKRDNQINLFKTEVFLSQWGQSEFTQIAVDRSVSIFALYPAYPSMLAIVAADMPLLGRDDLATEYNAIIDASK